MTNDDLQDLVANTWPVFLDFDGPVARLMPAPRNWEIADAMRSELRKDDITLPADIVSTADPLELLRYGYEHMDDQMFKEIEQVCIAGEVAAAEECQPTDGAHATIAACATVGRPLVVLSNNAPAAIETYLRRYDLGHHVLDVVGRPPGRPDLMKPHPALVYHALAAVNEAAERCVFVGDSVSDIEVSRRTGLRSLGYAKTSLRGEELAAAGADAITETMTAVAAAIVGIG
jgi:phosphoglycolate phosphatase